MSTKQTKIEKYTKAINKSSDPKKEKKKKIVFDEEDEVENEKVNTKGFEIKQSNSKVEYQKLELHEQILKRPDTYVKSIRTMMDPEPVYIMKENKIIAIGNSTYSVVLKTMASAGFLALRRSGLGLSFNSSMFMAHGEFSCATMTVASAIKFRVSR